MRGAIRSFPRGDRHPWSDEQLTIYLLGELPEAEMEALDAHLRSCDACREALARLDEVYVASVEELPFGELPGDELSAPVWQGIVSRTRGDEATRAPGAMRSIPTPPRAPRSPRSGMPWALAATLVVLAVTGGWGAWQRQLVTQARADVASLEARVQLLQNVTGTVEARADALGSDQARLARWLAHEAVSTARLSAADDGAAPGSVLFQADGRALVVMRELPAEGRDFQAWGVRDGDVTSLGAFEGRTVEVDAGTYEAVAVSLEPDGGSPTPTQVLGSVGAG